jgi:hypothetical protein
MEEGLRWVGQQIGSVLITAGSFVGFIAFAGGVIVWTRFYAAQVPPDQAVNAVPRDELVSIGASILLVFGFFGALALLTMYLVDRGGRATPGMSRALLILFSLEGLAAIGLVSGKPAWQQGIAALAFVLLVGLAIGTTFADAFVEREDWLPGRKDETLEPKRERAPVGWVGYKPKLGRRMMYVSVALAAAAMVLVVILVEWSEVARIAVGATAAALVVGLYARLVWSEIDKTRKKVERESKAPEGTGREEAERLKKRRPFRLVFRPWGVTILTLSISMAVVAPSLILAKLWLAGSLLAAMVLTLGLWRIAALSRSRFMWFGLAVFLSVPLFGTLSTMAKSIDEPQAQPLALIRDTDGPDEAIQGLYVTETDDRVYFATLATEGCGDKIVNHSGRLLWVPKSEVVAMSIGPLEDVAKARTTALEMAYALTPAVETPAGDHVSLTAGEERQSGKSAKAKNSSHDQRLENVGAAVRPNFGLGLRLIPEDASAGDVVTLRMSSPNEDVEGFGHKRKGRTLRLGGVPVAIFRETVGDAEESEFVKTDKGKVLALDKEGVYVKTDAGMVPLAGAPHGPHGRFVKLGDDSGVSAIVLEGEDSKGHHKERLDGYLEIVKRKGDEQLKSGQTLKFASGESARVEPRLLRQAWHENHIKFRVPENASTGVVSVECEQLAGQPLLRVARPPVARISVRMSPGSPGVVFDSKRSRGGNGEIVSRWWTVEGLRSGSGDRIAAEFPPRPDDDYVVGLTVTDSTGQTDSASFRVLRMPAKMMRFRENNSLDPEPMKLARSTLFDGVQRNAPSALEFDGAPDASSVGAGQTLKGEEELRDSLLFGGSTSPVDLELMVRTLAYDRSCPLHDGENVQGGVDVVMLSSGVQVIPPLGCRPGRVRIERGASLAPPEKPAPDDHG